MSQLTVILFDTSGEIAAGMFMFVGMVTCFSLAAWLGSHAMRMIAMHLQIWAEFGAYLKVRHHFRPWLIAERKKLGMNADGKPIKPQAST